jgi:hypothetical protein
MTKQKENSMKRKTVIAVMSALIASGALVFAQDSDSKDKSQDKSASAKSDDSGKQVQDAAGASTPKLVVSDSVTAQATVEDINKEDRTVTLKTDKGDTEKVKVGPAVENFDQIQKGDKVTATYYESAAISMLKPGQAAPEKPEEAKAFMVAAKGEKPAAVAVKAEEATATIEDIDKDNRSVKLKGPEGNTKTVKVGEAVDLDKLQKGDEVKVVVTQALAMKVSKQ